MPKMKTILRAGGLLACTIALVFCLSSIFRIPATTDSNFYKLEKNSVDVLFLGNCHAYSTFMPSVIKNVSGKNGYVLGGAGQNIQLTYYHLREALKRQSPSYVVLETFPILIYDSYTNPDSIDAYAHSNFSDLPLSFDKLLYALDYQKGSQWFYLWFDLGYFHDRWEEIQTLNYKPMSQDNGYIPYSNYDPLSDPEQPLELVQTDRKMEIDPDYLDYVYRIINLAEEKGIQLLFTTVPYTSMTDREAARLNTLGDIAEEHNIPFINFAEETMLEKLDFRRGYMIDAYHVNEQGGLILSEYMGNVLKEMDQIQTAAE